MSDYGIPNGTLRARITPSISSNQHHSDHVSRFTHHAMNVFRVIFDALIWRHQKGDVTRSVITFLGVALGVSVVVAIRLANQSVLGAFRDSIDRVAGRSNLQVRGDGFPIDETILEKMDWVFPLAEVAPVVSGTIVLKDHPEEVIEVVGVDLLRDQRTRHYRLLQADQKDAGSQVEQLLGVLTAHNAILLTQRFADRHGIKTGGEIDVLADDRALRLEVPALLANEGLGQAMSGSIGIMDIAAAQWLFSKFGQLDRIDLVVRDAERIPEVQKRLMGIVPPHVQVEPPSSRTKQVEEMISAYQLNLTALSWIALFVGIFLVYNTVSIGVIRRRREIGIARALGTPRAEIALAFGLEASVFGLVGAGLGLFVGWLLARGSVSAAAKTASAFYERIVVEGPVLDSGTMLLGLLTGLGLSLVAGLVPVAEAVSIPPAEASRTGSQETRRRKNVLPYTILGLVFLLLAAIAGMQPPIDRKPVFGFLAAFLLVLGFSFLSPMGICGIQRVLKGFMSRAFGSPGRIAASNLGSSLGRTSVTVAALMIGLAMTIGMGIMIESFRQTVDIWVDQTVKSDLWIKAASSRRVEGRISAETLRRIESVRGVNEIDPYREIYTSYNSSPVILGSGRFEVASRHSKLPMKEGGRPEAVLQKGQEPGGCIVSETFSNRHGAHPGDEFKVATPKGSLPLRIAGVYYEYSNDRGYIIIDRQIFIDHFGDDSANVVSVYIEEGEDIQTVRQRILDEVGSTNPLIVRTTAMLKAEVLRIFDRTFAITRSLQVIAIVIAVLGIVNTQIALVFERRREIAILRYLGTAVKQIRQIVILEAGLLGLVGVLLGLAAGVALAVVLIYVINRQSFGWTIQPHFPALYVGLTSLLVLASTMVAGIYPASVAARIDASEALRAE